MRNVVFGLKATRGARHGGIDVALVANHLARLPRQLLQHRLVGGGIVATVRAVLPLDLQRLPALDRRRGVLRDDRDATEGIELGGRLAALDLHHADHARHPERFRRIVLDDLALVDRRARPGIVRAAARTRRIGPKKWRVLREPSVSWLPNRFWSPGACTTRTRFQSASSSSATIIAMLVRTPCPISERCTTMVTVPSSPI